MRFWNRPKLSDRQTVASGLPLVCAQPGQRMRIVSINGGNSIQSRLAELGVFPQEEVQVLSRTKHGPLLLMVRGSKLALGRGLGQSVMVEETVQ